MGKARSPKGDALGRIWHVYRQHEWRVQRDMELAPKLAPWAPRVLTSSFIRLSLNYTESVAEDHESRTGVD